MQRREFLGKVVGSSLAVLSLEGILKGQESDFEKRAREYLRSIIPGRQRVEDFITGEYDLVVELETATGEKLEEVFTDRLEAIGGILICNSHLVMRQWSPPH